MAITVELKEITRDYLDACGIHEIREYARSVGVQHPTALKKQKLIDGILDIRDGKVEPQKGKKAGRPPKTAAPAQCVEVTPPAEPQEERKGGFTRSYIPQQRRSGDGRRRFGDAERPS